jgi:hypothetical protein
MNVSRTIPQRGPAMMVLFHKPSLTTSTSSSEPEIALPGTLQSFLTTYPSPPNPLPHPKHPNAPPRTPGLSELEIIRETPMPTDVPSLLTALSPMIPVPPEGQTATFINMLDRPLEEIWADFMRISRAVSVEPDPKDLELTAQLEKIASKAKVDSARSLAARALAKKDEELLKQARESTV